MAEIIYVLTNGAMEGFVKIGRTTTSVEQRIKYLDNTNMPLPFQGFYAGEMTDSKHVEKKLLEAFADKRVRNNRDFLGISTDQVVVAIVIATPKEVTPKKDILSCVHQLSLISSEVPFAKLRVAFV